MENQEVIRKILGEINRDPTISQKRLSDEVGISVGMINWHIKRCVAKGLIKLQHAPVRRYLYYLTPKGFKEKARLTGLYLQTSLNIFRLGREQYGAILRECSLKGWNNVVLAGNTELTGLVLMMEAGVSSVKIRGIIDNETNSQERGSIPIIPSLDALRKSNKTDPIDAVIACHFSLAGEEAMIDADILAVLELDQTRLIIPDFLR